MAVEVWTCGSCNPALRCGGWAFVRVAAGQGSGSAGGERGVTDAARMELSALLAALDPASGEPLTAHLADPVLVAVAARLAAGGAWTTPTGDPLPNLDLWSPVAAALAARRLSFAKAAPGPAAAFVASWAGLARDRAKDRGAFTAAIPKPNLAKALGLTG